MTITLGIPQFILLAWSLFAMIVSFVKHDEDIRVNGFRNFFIILVELAILYWGGFFT